MFKGDIISLCSMFSIDCALSHLRLGKFGPTAVNQMIDRGWSGSLKRPSFFRQKHSKITWDIPYSTTHTQYKYIRECMLVWPRELRRASVSCDPLWKLRQTRSDVLSEGELRLGEGRLMSSSPEHGIIIGLPSQLPKGLAAFLFFLWDRVYFIQGLSVLSEHYKWSAHVDIIAVLKPLLNKCSRWQMRTSYYYYY